MIEKKLTPAEKKKREEIAQAIKRDNPKMPMDKKMAIATAMAKKVAEESPATSIGNNSVALPPLERMPPATYRRYKKNGKTVMLKRFRDYAADKGIG